MVEISFIQMILSVFSGFLVGFSLGLIGGGGSILGIPLLIYLVGIKDPHMAIGTTTLAVGLNAFINVIPHLRKGHVDLKTGSVFAVLGVLGVLSGAELGLVTPGEKLLLLFAILIIIIAIYMIKRRYGEEQVSSQIKRSYIKIMGTGFVVGFASGYFGVGGGFLIVPGLIYSGGLDILKAVGTSLISVGIFGVTTALRYSLNGYLDLPISILYLLGGVLGGWLGAHVTTTISKKTLTRIFAIIMILVAIYMIYRTIHG